MTPVDNKIHSNSPPRPDKPLKRHNTFRSAQDFYNALRATDPDAPMPKSLANRVNQESK